jgi:hypothetical protein
MATLGRAGAGDGSKISVRVCPYFFCQLLDQGYGKRHLKTSLQAFDRMGCLAFLGGAIDGGWRGSWFGSLRDRFVDVVVAKTVADQSSALET